MSRTNKGSKHPGDVDFWSKRPCPWNSCGRYGKKVTHKLERQDGKREVEKRLFEE